MKETGNTDEMERLFREMDFAAEQPALKERLWQKIQMKIAGYVRNEFQGEDEERELTGEELHRLAAAGNASLHKHELK